MMAFWNTWALILAFLIGGCSQLPSQNLDPEQQPYQLQEVASFDPDILMKDLDNDGRFEMLKYFSAEDTFPGESYGYLQIRSHEDYVIEQVNFPAVVCAPYFLDLDHDGKLEIAVPLLRNDSLFVSLINASGEKLFSFFLIDGRPRSEPEGQLAWDPIIINIYLYDLNSDGHDELITVMNTGVARAPRGLLVHSLPDGRLLDQKLVGAAITESFFGDFDGDGVIEIVARTFSPNNGASAGGFDDRHSYIIVFKLSLPIQVLWSKQLGGMWSRLKLYYADFTGDDRHEFLAFCATVAAMPSKSRFEIIEPGTWRTVQQIEFPDHLRDHIAVDVNRDGRPEILTLRHPDEFWLLDQNFTVIKRRTLALPVQNLHTFGDADGDGINEIAAAWDQGFILFAPNLSIKATLPGGQMRGGIQKQLGEPPMVGADYKGKVVLMKLVKNNFYLAKRYGRPALWIGGGGLALVLLGALTKSRRRLFFLKNLQRMIFDSDTRGLLVLKPDGVIMIQNVQVNRFLKWPSDESLAGSHFTKAIHSTELLHFLQTILHGPAHFNEIQLALDTEQPDRIIQIKAHPISVRGYDRVNWLIQFVDKSLELEFHKAKTWGKMAQRIAHDIKNPLTAILLTQQRLQMEYREHSPEAAAVYDGYSSKIVERIEALRLMTRNFMKLVNLERLHLVETELHAFLRDVVQHLAKNMPPDVELEFKLNGHGIIADLDQDQIKVLLENLVSNAINAMPKGGRITITTNTAKGLLLAAVPEPRNYAVIEIRDTGKGMPPEMLGKIFELDFTATDNGTGLGLAMVKKIVDGHHGHIEVESESGAGTVFSLYFPVQ